MAHRKIAKRSKIHEVCFDWPIWEQSKHAVLRSLGAASSQESYGHAIDEFIGGYCSEPRLAFNRRVVLRYRFFLEQKNLAPSTINVRLAAVRRLCLWPIACDQIANQCGLATLTRTRNHDNRRVLERGSHQFCGKARKEFVSGIVHTGWRLRLIRINGSSISDYRLVQSGTKTETVSADSFRRADQGFRFPGQILSMAPVNAI